jgi:hypothetical protein
VPAVRRARSTRHAQLLELGFDLFLDRGIDLERQRLAKIRDRLAELSGDPDNERRRKEISAKASILAAARQPTADAAAAGKK